MATSRPGKSKRLAEAMAADKVWDKKHGIKEGSPQDKILDAAVARRVKKGK